VLLDDQLAGGDHSIRSRSRAAEGPFATVKIDAAIYAFSIATEGPVPRSSMRSSSIRTV
jgi:hypothetical protein